MKCFYFFHFCPQLYWALLSCGQKNRFLGHRQTRGRKISVQFPAVPPPDAWWSWWREMRMTGRRGEILQGPRDCEGFLKSVLEMLCNVKSHLLLFIQVIRTKVTNASMLLGPFCISNLHSNHASVHPIFNIRELRLREVKWLPQVHKTAQLS